MSEPRWEALHVYPRNDCKWWFDDQHGYKWGPYADKELAMEAVKEHYFKLEHEGLRMSFLEIMYSIDWTGADEPCHTFPSPPLSTQPCGPSSLRVLAAFSYPSLKEEQGFE